MTTMNESLGLFDKADKRLRGARVTEVLPKLGFGARTDFEGEKKTPPKKIVQLEKQLKHLEKSNGVKDTALQFDAEHNLWEAHFTDAQGAERKINWELASTPEYRQMISKYKQIQEFIEPPLVVETIGRSPATAQEGEADEELSETEREALAKTGVTEKEKKPAKPAAGKKKTPGKKVEEQCGRGVFEYRLNQGKKDFQGKVSKG